MPEPTQIFISYKTGETTGLTFQARVIKKELSQHKDTNYHVWFDKDSLEAGLDWNMQIYKNIPESDILLLLLAKETAESDWVRREIDIAKGAQVTILPVLIRDFDDLQKALERFDIPRFQAVSLYEGSDDEFEKLIAAIEQRKADTQKAQQIFATRLKRMPPSHPIIKSNPNYRIYSKEGLVPEGESGGGPKVHLAAGDIRDMKPIDVFVNSENDYMQMARVFDDLSISSLLRFHGSHFDGANRLLEDTLQNALTERVKDAYTTRPLGMGTVVATIAGHAESRLVKSNKARFVFHTAILSVRDDERGRGKELVPINDLALIDAVRRTLDTVKAVDDRRGVPPPQENSETYKPIESIIFPLMGTGSGGLPAAKVAPLMAHAIKGFILDEPVTSLKRIYICAYTQEDVDIVDEALKEAFAPQELNSAADGEG